jgi:hypothetical protein
MDRIPRLFVRKGNLVWPEGRRQWRVLVKATDDIVATAQALFRKHEDLYVVDVDGLEHSHANHDLYQRFERAQVFPWLEAGLRRIEDVMDAFFVGASRVTVRLRDMPPARLRELAAIAEEEIHLSLDAGRDGLEKGWRGADVASFVRSSGLDGVVLEAMHDAEPSHLDPVAFDLQHAGVPVTIAPWPATRPRVRQERYTAMLFDPEDAR